MRFASTLAFLRGCLPALILTVAPGLVQAQAAATPEPQTEVHGDWRVTCIEPEDASRQCVATQIQVQKEGGQRVLGIELRLQPGGAVHGVLALPFGLLLQPGVRLAVDEGEDVGDSHAFVTCLPDGCLVPLNFSAAEVERLRKGRNLNVRALAMGDRSVVKLPISLSGITAALRALEAKR